MDKQSLEREHTNRYVMGMAAVLLAVALVLSACMQLTGVAQDTCTPGREVDKTAYFTEVIKALQNPPVPVSDFAVNAFLAWEPYENTNACWNPLATTWDLPGSTDFNSVHVKNYPDQASGILATANTLNQTYNFYQPIRTMLAKQGFDEAALTQALVKWVGSSAYSDAVVAKWKELYNQ